VRSTAADCRFALIATLTSASGDHEFEAGEAANQAK